jgi:FkbM family methyltransferase
MRGQLVEMAMRRSIPGAGRLARGCGLVRTTLNGMPWEADPSDWIDQQVIRNGTYEPEITELLAELCGSGVLWDVGANVGVHAVSVAVRGGQVVAFEPTPSAVARLRTNADLNAARIDVRDIALADSRGFREFSIATTSAHNSLTPWPTVSYEPLQVWCDTGDHLLSTGLACPTVIKVDVEGGEASVFTGMPMLLSDRRLRHIVYESAEDGAAHQLVRVAGFDIEPIASTGGGTDWLASRPGS